MLVTLGFNPQILELKTPCVTLESFRARMMTIRVWSCCACVVVRYTVLLARNFKERSPHENEVFKSEFKLYIFPLLCASNLSKIAKSYSLSSVSRVWSIIAVVTRLYPLKTSLKSQGKEHAVVLMTKMQITWLRRRERKPRPLANKNSYFVLVF